MNEKSLTESPAFKRIIPFAAYMFFIFAFDLLKPLIPEGALADNFTAIMYLIKILVVLVLLVIYWRSYDELRMDQISGTHITGAITIGSVVFILWINMDWDFAKLGASESYDPNILPEKLFYAFVAVRLFGTALVVPVVE